uniref:Thioredoxin domain-containing protein n=1 Tax=Trichuris muris TaxID=70415 RepID=A0A5S6QC14_TRIMR
MSTINMDGGKSKNNLQRFMRPKQPPVLQEGTVATDSVAAVGDGQWLVRRSVGWDTAERDQMDKLYGDENMLQYLRFARLYWTQQFCRLKPCWLFGAYNVGRLPNANLVASSVSRYICTRTDNLSPKQPIKGPISWKNFAVSMTLCGILLAYMFYLKTQKDTKIMLQKKRAVGKFLIGGDWDLVDHNGKATSSMDYRGRWLLIYFGFTHCPDICPDEIEKMCKVADILEKDSDFPDIVPLFISVDPARDSPPIVKQYVEEFSPKLVGLTGSEEQVEKVCKAFRVYHSSGPKDVDDDYIVDHTIITYLINPDGDFVDYFGQRRTAEEIATAIRGKMLLHNAKQRKSLWGS